MTVRSLVRRCLAGAALLGGVVTVPVVLVLVAGWPLPTRMPDWARVATAFRQGDLPAAAVVKALACLVWVCWAQFAAAVVWEFIAQMRHPHDPPAQHQPPLVARSVHRKVGRMVAFVLSAGVAVATTPTPTLVQRHLGVAAAAAAPSPAPVATPHEASSSGQAVWVVAKGDAVWDIARIALGDGGRSTEILELNPTVVPRRLPIGARLVLPTDAVVPADRRAPSAAPAPVARTTAPAPDSAHVIYLPADTITVEVGDNLWTLAASRLDAADGPDRQPAGAEIAGYLTETIDANTIPSGNPSLIHPGERYTFPAIGTPPQADTTAVPTVVPSSEQPSADLPPSESPTTAATQPAAVPAPTPVMTTVNMSTATSTAPGSPASGSAPAPASVTDDADNSVVGEVIAGLSGAVVLAGGLLVAYRRRRQHASRLGTAVLHRPLPKRQHQIVDELVRSADVPLVRWANHELAVLMARLAPSDVSGTPLAMELSADHGIELLWDTPQAVAPAPWEAADGGWAWRLLYDPDHQIPNEPAIAPLAGMVSIGTRDGNQLLLNLEAFGTVALTGDSARAENLARAMVLELGSSAQLATATCSVVGLAVEADEHLWRVEHTTAEQAARQLTAQQTGYRKLLHDSGLPTAFHTRLGDPFDREVHVVVLDTEASTLVDSEFIEPNLGAALVMLGDPTGVATSIRVADDGSAVLEPLGVAFTAAGVSLTDASDIAELLDEVDSPAIGFDSDHELPDVFALPAPAEDDQLGETAEFDDEPAGNPSFVVRLLGRPRIDGVAELGPLEISIITFLACNGGSATPEQVIDAVWNGRLIERGTFLNRLTKTRRAAPGVLQSRSSGTRRLALGPGVTTDLELLERAFRNAAHASTGEAIEHLRAGLAYVDGVPFDSPNLDWPHNQQHHAHASTLIEHAALMLVDLALDIGDIATARFACQQGLIGLPLNEPLYCARMRVEAAAGHPNGIREAYRDLVRGLSGLDEGLGTYQPDPNTSRLYEQLLTASKLRPTG